jgi:hypothetical protein
MEFGAVPTVWHVLLFILVRVLLIRTYLLRSSFRQSVIFLDILLRTFLFGYIISNSGRCACHHLIGIIISEGRWLSPGTPISSTNETDCHDITDILL